jgi:hypothetical protein
MKNTPASFDLRHASVSDANSRVQNPPARATWKRRSQADSPKDSTMPKFLCLQRSLPGGNTNAEKPSPAQMQAMYAKFNEWREKFSASLVDLGGRLGAGRTVLPQPPLDGPFVEVKELVGGYMIVSAQSLDEAVRIARECPGLVRPGSGVEVIEIHAPG